MTDTPNLHLPYILAAQAQKHVTHNEAIRMLDALVQLTVLDRDLTAPPALPVEGTRYIVAAGPTGAWAGQALKIAAFQDGAWAFFAPLEGWIAWVSDEDLPVVWSGTAWNSLSTGGGSSSTAPLFGINTTADTTNLLAVASAASVFSHSGAGHQVKINKAAAANTASILLQDAFSGRAELGLPGDDDFHVKVSADGTTWREAIVIDRATGFVSMPSTPANENLLINGDFQLNQRAFAGGALAAGIYGYDRWKADTAGANVTVSGFTVTLTSGTLLQPIEPAVWGYLNLASTQITVSVDTPSADLIVTLGSASGTITAGAGRRSVTLTTGAGDTGNISLKFARSTAGTVTFSRAKASIGNGVTPWSARTIVAERQLASRYCQSILRGNGGSGSIIAPFYFQLVAGVVIDGLIATSTLMRASPILLSPSGAPAYTGANPTIGNQLAFYNNTNGGFATATGAATVSFNGSSSFGIGLRLQASAFTGTAGGVGNLYLGPAVNVLAEAEI